MIIPISGMPFPAEGFVPEMTIGALETGTPVPAFQGDGQGGGTPVLWQTDGSDGGMPVPLQGDSQGGGMSVPLQGDGQGGGMPVPLPGGMPVPLPGGMPVPLPGGMPEPLPGGMPVPLPADCEYTFPDDIDEDALRRNLPPGITVEYIMTQIFCFLPDGVDKEEVLGLIVSETMDTLFLQLGINTNVTQYLPPGMETNPFMDFVGTPGFEAGGVIPPNFNVQEVAYGECFPGGDCGIPAVPSDIPTDMYGFPIVEGLDGASLPAGGGWLDGVPIIPDLSNANYYIGNDGMPYSCVGCLPGIPLNFDPYDFGTYGPNCDFSIMEFDLNNPEVLGIISELEEKFSPFVPVVDYLSYVFPNAISEIQALFDLLPMPCIEVTTVYENGVFRRDSEQHQETVLDVILEYGNIAMLETYLDERFIICENSNVTWDQLVAVVPQFLQDVSKVDYFENVTSDQICERLEETGTNIGVNITEIIVDALPDQWTIENICKIMSNSGVDKQGFMNLISDPSTFGGVSVGDGESRRRNDNLKGAVEEYVGQVVTGQARLAEVEQGNRQDKAPPPTGQVTATATASSLAISTTAILATTVAGAFVL